MVAAYWWTQINLVLGLAAIWHSVCIHQMNQMNSRNGVL